MMFTENGGRPGDQRPFLHKKLLGVVGRVAGVLPIPGGSIISTIAQRLAGSRAKKEVGAAVKFGGDVTNFPLPPRRAFGGIPTGASGFAGPCDFPKVIDRAGRCRTPTSGEFGGEQFGVGAAVMGKYGSALEPGSMIVDRAICLRGMQLGDDGLCYNKGNITNKQRMWPAGRKPLLSGGDMRAITIAARAGRRLEGATKRLQRLGMMKKATPRRIGPHRHAKAATDVVSV